MFSEVEALAPKDGIVSLFRMRYDYHNAKTIVKAEAMGKDPSGLLLGGGRVDAIYQPYIDGEVELADLNAAYSESRKLVR